MTSDHCILKANMLGCLRCDYINIINVWHLTLQQP